MTQGLCKVHKIHGAFSEDNSVRDRQEREIERHKKINRDPWLAGRCYICTTQQDNTHFKGFFPRGKLSCRGVYWQLLVAHSMIVRQSLQHAKLNLNSQRSSDSRDIGKILAPLYFQITDHLVEWLYINQHCELMHDLWLDIA